MTKSELVAELERRKVFYFERYHHFACNNDHYYTGVYLAEYMKMSTAVDLIKNSADIEGD